MQFCCPYLMFDGVAEAAMRTYQQVLGGELKVLRYADAPAGASAVPPGCEPSDAQRVMHAMLRFEGGVVMCSDVPNSRMAEPMRGVSVSLTLPDAAAARRVFDGLSPQAREVRMPFGRTFWADGFGALVDRFGTSWMIGGGLQPV